MLTELHQSFRRFTIDNCIRTVISAVPSTSREPHLELVYGKDLDAVERQLFKTLSPRAAPFVPASVLALNAPKESASDSSELDEATGEASEVTFVGKSEVEPALVLSSEEEAEIEAALAAARKIEDAAATVIQRIVKKRLTKIHDHLQHSASPFVVFWSSYTSTNRNATSVFRGPLLELLFGLQAQCKWMETTKKHLKLNLKKAEGEDLDSISDAITEAKLVLRSCSSFVHFADP